ncbi:MAG: hypothetical protein AAFW97_05710 [Pseudomonadota bacterium]
MGSLIAKLQDRRFHGTISVFVVADNDKLVDHPNAVDHDCRAALDGPGVAPRS